MNMIDVWLECQGAFQNPELAIGGAACMGCCGKCGEALRGN